MTLFEFRMLNGREQANLIYENGVYIGKHRQDNMPVMLFQLYSFYVEVFYTAYRMNISHVRCFSSVDTIVPYIDAIEIDELFRLPDCSR